MKNKSFTLIELLVVIVIIGILAGVIIVSVSSSINKATIAKLKVFENNIQSELGANMVSRWKLDGNANDAWGSNNGTLGDGVTSSTYPTVKTEAECVTGTCMSFDGLNDYINCGNNADLDFITYAGTYTFSAWIYSSNLTGVTRTSIVGKSPLSSDRNVLSCYGSSVRFGYYNGIAWYGVSGLFTLNKWNYVAGINNGGSLSLYLDGVIQTENGNPYTAADNKLIIGSVGTYGATGEYWKGLIDDVRIYNGALSTSQIKQQYVAGLDSLLANNNISKEEYDQRINSLAHTD